MRYRLEDPRFLPNVYGVMSIMLPALLLTTTLLFLVLHWQLPLGSITFVIGVNSALMFFMSWGEVQRYPGLLIALVATGILGDALRYWLKPSAVNVTALRVFAFSLPFIMSLFYIVVLNQTALAQGEAGLWWTIHMWLGVPVVAAIGGLLLSILIVPSRPDQSAI